METPPAFPPGPCRGDDVSSPSGATLSFSHEIVPGKGLVVRAQVKNAGPTDIFVLDRLWRLDRASQKVADAEGIYRFERGGDLRLLLGAAPLPRRKNVLYRNVPQATKVAPGATLTIERTVPVPVKEYSPYFPELPTSSFRAEQVQRAHLMVQLIVRTPDLKTQPSTVSPSAVEIVSPVAALAHAEMLVSEAPAAIAVLRRTDEFDRVVLPGELPEPL